jgi:hypothetical protein
MNTLELTFDRAKQHGLLVKLELALDGTYHTYVQEPEGIHAFTSGEDPAAALTKAIDIYLYRKQEPIVDSLYLHYRGGFYKVIEVCDAPQDLDNGQQIPGAVATSDIKKGDRVVRYKSEDDDVYLRTVESFNQVLSEDGRSFLRFQLMD